MKFKQSLCLTLSVLSGLLLVAPVHAQLAGTNSNSGTLKRYQRKYISFFYPQDYPLNRKLSRTFEADFPRFDYHLASTSFNLSLRDFLAQTQAYQKENAGTLAAGKKQPNQRFGDKVVSWSETQRIAQSAYVFVPHWTFGKIELEGPYPKDKDDPGRDWYMHAVSEVELDMKLYNLKKNQAGYEHLVNEEWDVKRSKAIRIRSSLIRRAAAAASTPSNVINLKGGSLSSSERSRILKELYKNRNFIREVRRVQSQSPERYMMDAALDDVSMGRVIGRVRGLDEFLIRAEISEPDMTSDKIEITLGEGETADTLNIRTDASYKVIEYVTDGNIQTPREVGYIKVRDKNENILTAQPIIVDRDFELGDQVVEYPKSGFGLNLRGGGIYSLDPQGAGGGLGVDFDINLGPGLGLSETYVTLSGSYLRAVAESTDFSGGLVELGLQKKWYMRQLIFAAALRGGGMFSEPSSAGGVTGLLGLHWQQSPEFAYGVDAGWRHYLNGQGTFLSGPVLEAFIRFDG